MKVPSSSCLVAIVGGSGAGKSWLAARLERILREQAGRIALDDFYRDRSHLRPARRALINYDHPRAIDWPRVDAFLRDCRQARPTAVPRYDFNEHRRLEPDRPWRPRPIVLFEGLWLLARPGIRRLFDFSIFIECPGELRFRRRLARDVAERGRSPASVRQQFRQAVSPMHDRFVAPQQRWADLVLRQPLQESDVLGVAAQLRRRLPPENRALPLPAPNPLLAARVAAQPTGNP